ncbi:hypothetical protein BX600DRAFT_102498 [Xylariales sp. PMI_506]|nr:hypothetical protein BX600DRAFT_102498 [Xylariales sp. PMI_506]
MDETPPAASFTLFASLPLELQRYIWQLTLPARVIELDTPDRTPDPVPSLSSFCSSQHTLRRLNTRPPIATRICHESRSIALGNGVAPLWADYQLGHDPQWAAAHTYSARAWARPSTDVLHLNWWPAGTAEYPTLTDPIKFVRDMALKKDMCVSIMAPLIMEFDESMQHAWGLSSSQVFSSLGGSSQSDAVSGAVASYLVTMCVVNLHIGLDQALNSGLFGQLGEEPVQLVDVHDKAVLQAYESLWKSGPAADTDPAAFFNFAVERHESAWLPKIAGWEDSVKLGWLWHCWSGAQATDFQSVENPLEIWTSVQSDSQYGSASTGQGSEGTTSIGPNMNHPWVIQALQTIPHFEPRVMMRLCGDKCFAANHEVVPTAI